jgi:hypothetical protein
MDFHGQHLVKLIASQPEKSSGSGIGFGFTSVFIRVHPWLKKDFQMSFGLRDL